ncbi:MAG: glycosyltransferase 87 family protein [Gammaproteobacteria bacterium]|nr:glycosyltransferase 87 family protein [Gammaproteobacteria bacterium]
MYLIFAPFVIIGANISFIVYNIIFCAFIFLLYSYYTKSIKNNFCFYDYFSIFLILFLSYPILFCLDRGNLENLLFVFISLFLISFQNKKYYLSAILLAIAIGMKMYPIVFIVLFVKEKKYFELVVCLVFSALLSFFALFLLRGGMLENISSYLQSLHQFKQHYVLTLEGMRYSASIFSVIKTFLLIILEIKHKVNSESLYSYALSVLPYYNVVAVTIFGLVALYIIKCEEVFWKNALLLLLTMILLPQVSYDYKLIYLLLPFFLFLNRQYFNKKYDLIYLFLFALLFIPKNYFISFKIKLAISNCVNVLLMLGFILTIIYDGMVSFTNKNNRKKMI